MKCKVHKLGRVRMGKDGKYLVMKCAVPNCSFFHAAKMCIGRITICWACGDQFVLTVNDIKLKPTCPKHKPQPEEEPEIEAMLKGLKLA